MPASYVFTIAISQLEAEALARGALPPELQELQQMVISLLIDVQATPGEAIAAMARRNPKSERK